MVFSFFHLTLSFAFVIQSDSDDEDYAVRKKSSSIVDSQVMTFHCFSRDKGICM